MNNYFVVIGVCLMCWWEVFEKVGGFDEELVVVFNDVDLCLKMLYKGYWNVYVFYVVLYYYEFKSRGVENIGEK